MRDFINILNEFEKPDTGGNLPPAELTPDHGGGEEGGTYWVGPSGKVLISREEFGADHAQMVFRNPAAFGLTWDDIEKDAEPFEFHARGLRNWKAAEDAGTHSSEYARQNPEPTLGGRALGQNILFRRGWIMVRYDPPQRIAMWGCAQGFTRDIEHIMEMFPLMKLDEIGVRLFNSEGMKWDAPKGEVFKKKDYPGFGGHVNAMMAWINAQK